ncbi:MAG: OmpH family outer membrane protein [Bacillota bacterium]
MSKQKLMVFTLVFSLILGVAGFVQAADAKIGYVNMDEVYQAHPTLQEEEQNIQQRAQKLQKEYREKIQELDPEEDQEKIQKLQQEFREKVGAVQEDYEAEKNKIDPQLDEARKELGLDLILKEDTVVSGGEDVTDEIIEYFSEELDSNSQGNSSQGNNSQGNQGNQW